MHIDQELIEMCKSLLLHHCASYNDDTLYKSRDAESLYFCGTPDSDSGPKNLDSDCGPKISLALQDVMCDTLIVYLRMTENVNSSNKRCTVVYKQNFNRKLN